MTPGEWLYYCYILHSGVISYIQSYTPLNIDAKDYTDIYAIGKAYLILSHFSKRSIVVSERVRL